MLIKKNKLKKDTLGLNPEQNLDEKQSFAFVADDADYEVLKPFDNNTFEGKEEESLGEQIFDFLGDKSKKFLNIEKEISQEEIDKKAEEMIQAKAEEMLADLEEEIRIKRQQADRDIEKLVLEAQTKSNQILEEAEAQAQFKEEEIDIAMQNLDNEQAKLIETIKFEKENAYQEAMKKTEVIVEELIAILSNFHNMKKDILLESKDEILSIALDVAKQILNYEVKANDKLLDQQLLNSIQKLINSKGVIQIYLNPEDMVKEDYLAELLAQVLDSSVRVIFAANAEIDQGSCSINTQGGRLDASFSTQIATIKGSFEAYLGHKINELKSEPSSLETEIEDEEMSKSETNNTAPVNGPSDKELEDLEENFDDIVDLDIDSDLEGLLNEVLTNDEALDDVKSEPAKAVIDHDDSTEIGANDFFSDDELSLDNELNLIDDDEDEDLAKKEKPNLDEDGTEFVEFDEFASDENFSDEGEDDRFPEY